MTAGFCQISNSVDNLSSGFRPFEMATETKCSENYLIWQHVFFYGRGDTTLKDSRNPINPWLVRYSKDFANDCGHTPEGVDNGHQKLERGHTDLWRK